MMNRLGSFGVATLLLLPALGACSDDGGGDENNSTETSATGDGDGDGDSGDGDGDSGDGDGDSSGDGDGDSGDGDGDSGDGDGDPAADCDETHAPGDGAAEGEACTTNDDCASHVCVVFQDVPAVEGSCGAIPDSCATRLMGRVLDFSTLAPLEGADLRLISAVDASLDPGGAAGVAQAVTDANGEFDVVSDGQINAPIGLVGAVEGEGYYLTATGAASPIVNNTLYGPANTNHDLWAVPAEQLTSFSNLLMLDPEFANFVPLGDNGGVVGFVRDAATGDPIAGAVVVPTQGDESSALVRFLDEGGNGFNTMATASSGIFVIADPGLGETFAVEVDGMVVGEPGRAGSTNGGIFTLVMDI